MLFVIGFIAIDFLQPPFRSRLWDDEIFAALMTMPEAAMNEDDGFVFGQDDVGFARQGFVVELVAEALGMEETADEHLGLGVFAADLTHVIAAGSFVVDVCHDAKIGVMDGV